MAKVRSPNYPVISLADAVGRVSIIFDKETRHPADREVIAKTLGYGGLNGASMGIISALTKYGLLESVGDQLRVSTMAMDIILHSPGEPERVAAVRSAALTPPLFSELHDRYGDRLPSDQNIRAYLVKKGFNPKTVDGVIRSYRDTMTFADAESGASSTEVGDAPDYEESIPVMGTTEHTTLPRVRPAAPAIPPPQQQPGDLVLSFNLAPETEVRAAFRGHVTQEAIRKFIQLLEVSLDTFPARDAPQHVQPALEAGRQISGDEDTSDWPRALSDRLAT